MFNFGDYIPDLTERYPEGFGGVDMTPGVFRDPYDDFDKLMSGYDDIDAKTEEDYES